MIFILAAIGTVIGVAIEASRDREMRALTLTDFALLSTFLFFFIAGVLVTLISMWRVIAENL